MRAIVLLFSLLLFGMAIAQSYGVYQDCSKNGVIYTNGGKENGHEGVNLGLSVKWATCNVGATTPEGYGNYYAWGETSSKSVYNYYWNTYKYGNSGSAMTKYCTNSSYGIVDNKTILEKADDAASINWGGSWRMPTKAEWDELMNNCTATWTSNYNGTGVAGRIFTSKTIGYTDRSIFLPAAGVCNTAGHRAAGSNGFYWSSSLTESSPNNACELSFDLYQMQAANGVRCYGFSVRSVCPLEAKKNDTVTLYTKGCSTPNTIIVPEDSTITINAWAQEHYHFTQWSDGNTSTPRTIIISKNTTYTAEFAPDTCKITTLSTNGIVFGAGTYNYNTSVTLTATPNEHYHFVQWSDGNTSNPRTITVTKDSTFTAVFALDQFTITATGEHGIVTGTGTYNYGAMATLTATNSDCYSFQKWSDGNTDNPRSVVVTQDSTFTALFVGTGYQETVNCTVVNESPYGTVSFTGTVIKNSNVSLQATAPECSKFVKWSDNDTSNPRNLTVTKDSTLTAIFEKIQFNITLETEDENKGEVNGE